MGVGFKLGGCGYFKAALQITANPGAVVTITYDTTTQQKTADANGNVSFIVRKKGAYIIDTDFGFSTTVDVTAYTVYTINAVFSATVVVKANPNAVITLTHYTDTNIVYSGTANSVTGIANITVRKAGQYTVSSNIAASYSCTGNADSVQVSQNGSSTTIQHVKMTIANVLNAGNYSHCAVLAYWSRPTANWTGVNIRYRTGSAPASRTEGTNLYTGKGNAYTLNANNQNLNGITVGSLTAGTRYYFSMFNYITINGTTYWSVAYRTTSIIPISTIDTIESILQTKTYTIPAAWRKIRVFMVGGGGGGSAGRAGSGGGGGYTLTSSDIDVIPGQQINAVIGAGGWAGGTEGGSGGTTSFGELQVAGGSGGYTYNYGGYSATHGGDGGSGGGAGSSSSNDSGAAGGSNGSNGNSTGRTTGGTGQGSTTRAFGLNEGTLYAGGGGGGEYYSNGAGAGGAGGGGAGGSNGSARYSNGVNATANTGGGGGGAGYAGSNSGVGGTGGSGIILVKCVA